MPERKSFFLKQVGGSTVTAIGKPASSRRDSLTHNPRVNRTAALANLTTLLNNVFSGHFVLPVLGHDDPDTADHDQLPYKNYSELWKHWLPEEALVTFRKGGYYTFERTRTRLRLVAINTNLSTGSEGGEGGGEDPAGQWQWLESVLKNSRAKNETVYIVGHTPPGVDEKTIGLLKAPSVSHHSRYLSLVRNYSDIITGQFFGHLHSDTFRIVYDKKGSPVSRVFVAPSLCPRRYGFSSHNNPGVRLYKIAIDTGQVLDYSQYFLDLDRANEAEEEAEWSLLYNFTDFYSLQEPSPEELNYLAENFTGPEGNDDGAFKKFLQAYSVNASVGLSSITTTSAHGHYCAITRMDSAEYFNCVASAPAPLAAVTAPAPLSKATPSDPAKGSRLCLVFAPWLITLVLAR